jgi:ABC-type molybdate transport system substrate-binding protein
MTRRQAWRAAIVGGFLLGLVAGCDRTTPPARLRVLCGTSMAEPMKRIAAAFQAERGVEVEFDLGGSETLLPKVLAATASGDVYVCHDPFEAKVREAGKWAQSVVPGWLVPIVVVAPGNPKQVRGWDDLRKAGLRVGIGDPRYSTCGELFVAELRRRKLEAETMRNVVMQARSHAELATGVAMGALDAAVVWNFVAPQYRGKLEPVSIGGEYPETRVTVIGLSHSPQPTLRDAFLEWCRRPQSIQIFAAHGYAR